MEVKSLLNLRPTFLYPASRQFPFDGTAETIVRELEKRNWNIPGMRITMEVHGSGEDKYVYVGEIVGKDFRLKFGMSRCSGRNADISEICIPQREIHVYNDESGPTYWYYVGDDWDADKDWWNLPDKKNLAKMHGEPKRYLKYRGDHTECGPTKRPTILVPYDDVRRDYLPEGDEPTEFSFAEVMDEMMNWLKEKVLARILEVSTAQLLKPPFELDRMYSFHAVWDTIYSVADWDTHLKIEKGKRNPEDLEPNKRFAVGYPARRHYIHENGETKKDVKYWTHICCDPDIDEQVRRFKVFRPEVRREHGLAVMGLNSGYMIAIKPKYANDIYVVDYALPEEKRVLVPINDYNGGFENPLVWICRELEFDEIADMKLLPRYTK